MRIALAQLNPTVADIAAIRQDMLAAAQDAKDQNADFIVYSELMSIGYPPRDLLDRKRLVFAQWTMVQDLAKELPLPAVIGCVEPMYDERLSPHLANAAVVVENGEITASYHKRLLPTYDLSLIHI